MGQHSDANSHTRKGVVHAVFVKVWVPIALAALTMNDRCASKALQMPAQSPGGSANANPARCIFLQGALPTTKLEFDLPVLHHFTPNPELSKSSKPT